MGIDRIDSRILAALQKNARLSNKELAAAVQLAPSSCHERVRKLQASGALRGAHADVATDALGVGLQAMIGVRLRQHSREQVTAFRRQIVALEEVVAVYYLAGATDFLIHVAVRDASHLRDFGLDALTARPEVSRVETSLIFDHDRDPVLPDYAHHGDER